MLATTTKIGKDQTEAASRSLLSQADPADYFALLKPGVMRLVVFTALVGLVCAFAWSDGQTINLGRAIIALLCISIGAGASGALNMWYDADIDRIMKRTARRPIPAGKVTTNEALTFGIVLSGFSVAILGLATNWLAAFLLAFTIFFYAVVYTMWLKRSTPQNIVIGGAAGAFPPMIAWVAVTGSLSIESAVLFLIIFLWTPPHFWALSLFSREDYQNAKIPMLPVVSGEAVTRKHILIYSLLLIPAAVAPLFLGFGTYLYGVTSIVLTAIFIYLADQVLHDVEGVDNNRSARRLFIFSIFYLFALFAALLLEASLKIVWTLL